MTTDLLAQSQRFIRRVGPPDAPCEAVLAEYQGENVLLVDTEEPGVPDAAGWHGSAHIWAPIDIVRRADGHDFVMPRAVEKFEVFLHRRMGDHVRAGELVTLAVSVLRGLSAARLGIQPLQPGPSASWWVTDAGKPVVVFGEGESIDNASRAAVESLIALAPDRETARVLAAAQDVCNGAGTLDSAAAEQALCAHAAPQPVVLSQLGERTGHDQWQPASRPKPPRVPREATVSSDTLWRRVAVQLKEKVATLGVGGSAPSRLVVLSRKQGPSADPLTEGAERRRGLSVDPMADDTQHRRPRGRLLLIAVGIAIAGVVIGLMLPGNDSTTSTPRDELMQSTSRGKPTSSVASGVTPESAQHSSGEPDSANDTQDGTDSRAPELHAGTGPRRWAGFTARTNVQPSGTADANSDQPLVQITTSLLTELRACESSGTCASSQPNVNAAEVPVDAVVELIEDYGGVAVLRASSGDGQVWAVTVEKWGESWMVRKIVSLAG